MKRKKRKKKRIRRNKKNGKGKKNCIRELGRWDWREKKTSDLVFYGGYEGFRETRYKKKSNFSRSFVRERSFGRRCTPPLPSSCLLFLPLLFLHSRFSSLVLHRSFSHFSKEFVTTASSTDASLTLSLSMPLCSSWPYATRKPNLKITIEFRVCALDRKRRRERARQRREEGGRDFRALV